jgi:HAD superfamily hydrolase (TIGR01509 family)
MAELKKPSLNSEVARDIEGLYGGNLKRVEHALNTYKGIYELPLYMHFDNVTPELFKYCKRRSFFVKIIAVQDSRIFLKRTIGATLGWELPGSAVNSKSKELLEDSVIRILNRDIPNVDICDLRPIAVIQKTYSCGTDTVNHFGLAFMGRVRRPEYKHIVSNESIKGALIDIFDDKELGRLTYFDMLLFHLAVNVSNLSKTSLEVFDSNLDAEIDSHVMISSARHRIHNSVRKLGISASKKIKSRIHDQLTDLSSVIDVACGDDLMIYDIARDVSLAVANDVVWPHNSVSHEMADAVFHTNHDAKHLPFEYRFDGVICKNVVHHMDTANDLESLFESLDRICGKKIIIVDPADPKQGNFNAKAWNLYYSTVLKDQGAKFVSKERFEKIVLGFFKDRDYDIVFEDISTVKGIYLMAILSRKVIDGNLSTVDGGRKNCLKVVIFDMDGLLVESESIFANCVISTLQDYGVNATVEDYVESDMQQGVSLLSSLKERRLLDDIESIEKKIHELYSHRVEHITALPGAVDFVRRCSKQYSVALCTSSRSIYVTQILKQIGLEGIFQSIVARESVMNQKPSPEGLQKICSELNVCSEECIVIEDSKRGLVAATSAGMACLVIPSHIAKEDGYLGASAICATLEELPLQAVETAWLHHHERQFVPNMFS